mgnify:FL=1
MITLDKTEEVHISIYHIGYTSEGESSLFILHTLTGNVLYSLVIDCYEENCNETDRILSEWKLEGKVNLIIWTHPHDDHSIGMKHIIEKYSNESTKICTANVFTNIEQYSEECQTIIWYLYSLNKGKRAVNRREINPLCHFPEKMDRIEFNGKNIIKEMEILCIAPFSNLGGMQGLNKANDLNQIGIACIVKVLLDSGYINFMFAGDMDHATIELLNSRAEEENIPRVYNYIKIPHHGSAGSSNMIEFLTSPEKKKSEYATTSVFKKCNLPVMEVLKNYKKVTEEVVCTSDIESGKYGVGVIHLEYNLNNLTVKKEYEGTVSIIGS